MKVLVLFGGGRAGVASFKKASAGLNDCPRYPQSYPFYGALQREGIEVNVISVGGTSITDRSGKNPPGAWTAYLGSLTCVKLPIGYDVVVGWGLSTSCLVAGPARLSGQSRKVAHISFFTYSETPVGLKEVLRQRVFRSAVRNAGKTILMTQRQVSEVKADSGCDTLRVAHLPVGVDVRFFNTDPSPSEEGIRSELRAVKPQSYVVVAGDQLREESDYPRILNGLGIGLIRLTQNKYTEDFWSQAARRGEIDFPVLCVAHLTAREVRFAYQRAFCALNFIENSTQPAGWTVMTEAMACGLPVIATNGLTTEELGTYQSKGSASPFLEIQHLDTNEARFALDRLVKKTGERQRIGRAARQFVEQHLDIEMTSRRAIEILEEIAITRSRDTVSSGRRDCMHKQAETR